MSSQKFVGIFAAIFILGLLPLLLIQALGTASAGFSVGFMLPMHVPDIALFLLIGIGANYLGRRALAMLPLSFLAMLLAASAWAIESAELHEASIWAGSGLLLFALAVARGLSRTFLVAVAISASVAYHLGHYYVGLIPDIASPLYFLMGIMLSTALILATGVSIGLALTSELGQFWGRLKSFSAVSSFLSFF